MTLQSQDDGYSILKSRERQNRPSRFEPRAYEPRKNERAAEHDRLEHELEVDFVDSRENQEETDSVLDELEIPSAM